MFWLIITIIAYLLFALANVGDKLMVSQYKTEPIVYAFYVGILGIGALLLIPFGVIWPGWQQFIWAMAGGVAFMVALYCMYKAMSGGETTRAVTIIGGVSPIMTLILSYLFLDERLGANQIIAFIILVCALIIISWQAGTKSRDTKIIIYAVLAGLAFAVTYIVPKYLYLHQPFVSGFFWVRIGGFITAVIIWLIPRNRQLISLDYQRPKKQKTGLLIAIQALGGTGVICQNYAISLASATLINALQTIQYALVFIFALVLKRQWPVLREKMDKKMIAQKAAAIILIGIGLYFLALK